MPDPWQKTEHPSALAIPQRGNPGPCQNQTGAPGCNPSALRPDHRRACRIRWHPHLTGRAGMQDRGTASAVPVGHGAGRPERSFSSRSRRLRDDSRGLTLLFQNLENFRRDSRTLLRFLRLCHRRCSQLPAVATVGATQPLDPFCQRLRHLKDCMTVGAFNAHSINPFDSRLRSGLA